MCLQVGGLRDNFVDSITELSQRLLADIYTFRTTLSVILAEQPAMRDSRLCHTELMFLNNQ